MSVANVIPEGFSRDELPELEALLGTGSLTIDSKQLKINVYPPLEEIEPENQPEYKRRMKRVEELFRREPGLLSSGEQLLLCHPKRAYDPQRYEWRPKSVRNRLMLAAE